MEPAGDDKLQERIMRAVLGDHSGNKSSNINIVGADRWQLGACLLLTAVAALSAAGAVLFAMDARSEMRSNNTNREADIRELRQSDNAIRAYINTGRMPAKGK